MVLRCGIMSCWIPLRTTGEPLNRIVNYVPNGLVRPFSTARTPQLHLPLHLTEPLRCQPSMNKLVRTPFKRKGRARMRMMLLRLLSPLMSMRITSLWGSHLLQLNLNLNLQYHILQHLDLHYNLKFNLNLLELYAYRWIAELCAQ